MCNKELLLKLFVEKVLKYLYDNYIQAIQNIE